jgi:probable 2-oxoglutarate dehydrogenase E1 component DHKTD1
VPVAEAYRRVGHLRAKLDPLNRTTAGARYPEVVAQLPEAGVNSKLEAAYCGHLTVQAHHLANSAERAFWENLVENREQSNQKSSMDPESLLKRLAATEAVDHFLARKFPSLKRYGCEGSESAIVALEHLFNTAKAKHGVSHVVVGMPHRGRLNLLLNSLNYPAAKMFAKIKGVPEIEASVPGATHDVLSHLAASATLPSGVHVSLLHNPSHLEAVNPVAMGKAKAKAQVADCQDTLCVLVHGDAAVAGQGVVYEALQLMSLPNFSIGGTMHVVVNNQLGFTTDPMHSRSTPHATDLFRGLDIPIVHVNADSPQDVLLAVEWALQYRALFKKDVVVDVVGYRRWGHNEVDEPAFTQPSMYAAIRAQPSIVSQEAARVPNGAAVVQQVLDKMNADLEAAMGVPRDQLPKYDTLQGQWSSMREPSYDASVWYDTGLAPRELIEEVIRESATVPESFVPHDRLLRTHLQARLKRLEAGKVDWATAEVAALGTLGKEGFRVRVSGQDVERGTFSQRHLALHSGTASGSPAQHRPLGKTVDMANSPLSEESVLGYEFGWTMDHPKNLGIWEAQFGDFWNTAQVIFDTFVSSSIPKWRRQSSLVMSLPHGYDGAGPEHSSSRVERILQQVASADMRDDMVSLAVIQPSTPAQMYHALRRQMTRSFRVPLVVVGPKTLLRLPEAVSTVDELASGKFEPVLDDPSISDETDVRVVMLCSGKVYYDIVALRQSQGEDRSRSVAVVRLEEMWPFPSDQVRNVLDRYGRAERVVWVQEEPRNQGAWNHVQQMLSERLGVSCEYVGRRGLPVAAVGAGELHKQEVTQLNNDIVRAMSV